MLNDFYFNAVAETLKQIEETQNDALTQAAQAVAACFEQDGILHTFGCGHSGSTAIDAFHRSGCFAGIDAILDPGLMFQCGAHAGTGFERLEGYAKVVLARHNFSPKDVLLVVSNSGRNPAGIDAVLYAKEKGVKTIVITASGAHTVAGTTSRHSSGKMLKDVADIVVDNCCSANETALEIAGVQTGPVSSVACISILHSILFRAAQLLAQKGIELPIYRSSNAGGDAHNAALAVRYQGRIKQLD